MKLIYEGIMLDGVPNGGGTLTNSNGYCYKGTFDNGRKHGLCK